MGAMIEKEIDEKIEEIAMQIEDLSAFAGGMLYEDIFEKIKECLDIFALCD